MQDRAIDEDVAELADATGEELDVFVVGDGRIVAAEAPRELSTHHADGVDDERAPEEDGPGREPAGPGHARSCPCRPVEPDAVALDDLRIGTEALDAPEGDARLGRRVEGVGERLEGRSEERRV